MSGRIGQQLGNYRLISLLGRGGFAEVYLGEHIYLKSQAAIKILYARLAEEDLQNFLSEARVLVKLIHPHIVRLLDFGVQDDTPFLVMDYAPNGTLRQHYPRGTILPLTTVVSYASQLADALQYAHNNKIVHCDIKPENMLIGRNNEVLLTDFGIAVVAQSSRQSIEHQVAGTIAYMAPEQIQSHPRAASDQYALAVVIYEWLTGERPFQGSFTEVAAKHALTPPPPLREKNPAIPAAVEQVILTALQKDPAQRFPNIRVFADMLEQASKGLLPVSVDKELLPTRLPLSPLAMTERTIPAEIIAPPVQMVPHSRGQNFSATPPNTPLPHASSMATQSSDKGQSTQQRRRTGFFALGLLILLLAGAFASWFALSHIGNPLTNAKPTASTGNARTPVTTSPTRSVTRSPSTTSTGYPDVAGTYSGSIHNTYANIYSSMTLSISQHQGSISGQFTVAQPLQGSGPFNGSIKTDGTLQFLVRSTDTSAPILFTGSRQADGSLSGNYCSVNQNLLCDKNAGGFGVWNVTHS